MLLAAAGLALAHIATLAPFAYILTGLALAPVFPTGLAWLTATAPSALLVIAPACLCAALLLRRFTLRQAA